MTNDLLAFHTSYRLAFSEVKATSTQLGFETMFFFDFFDIAAETLLRALQKGHSCMQ